MANKRRPKKARVPYRRYVYGAPVAKDESNSDVEREVDLVPENGDAYTQGYDYQSEKGSSKSLGHKRDQCGYTNGDGSNGQEDVGVDGVLQSSTHIMGLTRLPPEVIAMILEMLYYKGELTPKILRVCRLFYQIALPLLYIRPHLKATNFFAFVDTIGSSKTIGNHIVELDLSYIIQSGKNAFVAKLLKRSRNKLQLFVAPQTSFGLGPLLALKNCKHLKVLDLRLVSETLNLEELFKSIKDITDLTHLSFPRSSIEINDVLNIKWPPKLSFLRISGGVSDQFLFDSEFPDTITQLEFAHCPFIQNAGLHNILSRLGHNLRGLKIQYPMPGLKLDAMDMVFTYCPNLISLEITVDYVSSSFFDEENLHHLPYPRPLRNLYIDSSGMLGTSIRLDPIDLAVALNDKRLPLLANIRCTAKLGWDPNSEYVTFIVDMLDDRGGGLYIGY